MEDIVLSIGALCVISYATGRVAVSNKPSVRSLFGPLLGVIVVGVVTFIASYHQQAIFLGLVFGTYCLGFMGKDSLKLPLRQQVRPKLKKAAGGWKQSPTTTTKNDDWHVV